MDKKIQRIWNYDGYIIGIKSVKWLPRQKCVGVYTSFYDRFANPFRMYKLCYTGFSINIKE